MQYTFIECPSLAGTDKGSQSEALVGVEQDLQVGSQSMQGKPRECYGKKKKNLKIEPASY